MLIFPYCSAVIQRAPRLVAGALRCFHTYHTYSQGLLYQSSEIPVTPKTGWNALLGSDTLLNLTHLSFHSTSSQTLLEAPSDLNTFCWCNDRLSLCLPMSWSSVNTEYSISQIFTVSRSQLIWYVLSLVSWWTVLYFTDVISTIMISKFAWSWASSILANLLDDGLHVYLKVDSIMASTFAWLLAPSVSLNLVDYHL